MPKVEQFAATLPSRQRVEIVVLELPGGRIIARTLDELAHADEETRIAAGLAPAPDSSGGGA